MLPFEATKNSAEIVSKMSRVLGARAGALLMLSSVPALAGEAERILSVYRQFAAAKNAKDWRISAPLTISLGEAAG